MFHKGDYVRMKLSPNTRMGTVEDNKLSAGTFSISSALIRDSPSGSRMFISRKTNWSIRRDLLIQK